MLKCEFEHFLHAALQERAFSTSRGNDAIALFGTCNTSRRKVFAVRP